MSGRQRLSGEARRVYNSKLGLRWRKIRFTRNCAILNGSSTGRYKRRRRRRIFPPCSCPLHFLWVTAISAAPASPPNLSLDVGIPVDRLGSGGFFSGLRPVFCHSSQSTTNWFTRSGSSLRFSPRAEIGIARSTIRRVRRNRQRIVSVRHDDRRRNLRGRWFFAALYSRTATGSFTDSFFGIDVAGGARIDTGKAELFFAGVTFGGESRSAGI